MRILIEGGNSGSGGYIRHLHGILSNDVLPENVEIVLLCSPSIAKEIGNIDPKVRIIVEPCIDDISRYKRMQWWKKKYPIFVRSIAPDLIFYPTGFIRNSGMDIPTVVLSHNLLPFDLKEIFRYGLSSLAIRMLYTRYKQKRSFLKANGVIFLSNHAMKKTSKVIFPIRNSKVIYHGLDSIFFSKAQQTGFLHNPIEILYVSTIYLYKHQNNVVLAVDKLRKTTGLDIRLTLIGGGEPIAISKLKKCIKLLNKPDFVNITGNLPLSNIITYYQNSDIFVFASSCETFGISLLEAMGAGLPIASSDMGPMTEILGDAACFFNPETYKSIVKSLEKLIFDSSLRLMYGNQAYEKASSYTWKRCSVETYDYFQSIVNTFGSDKKVR